MRWWLIFAVLAATLLVPVAVPGTARACSCAYAPDGPQILEQVAHAQGVFTGTATAQRIDGDTAYYEFAVREVFAGQIGATTVVSTSTQSNACGTGFGIGTDYLVFAGTSRSHRAPWSDGLCSATTQSTNTRTRQAAIEVYGSPRAPDSDQGPVDLDAIGFQWEWWATGIAGTALIVVLAAGWIHRRRLRQ